ncbi:zinc dependent phospholipase C family protein [Chitinophaga sp. sic0106]|uniref:zinc dependent phospholipase C family protein n=1 Tax=Chitinophaga sp. sic0106 TaxID=2854785 RepID=UPI00210455CC|nr:zinc dependent phospholipase C family protein [Chitinophaga sp. sic0106]
MLTHKTIRIFLTCLLLFPALWLHGWGFFAHQRINRLAVFCLPPEMMVLYKPHLEYITLHATDPDKRRYMVPAEGPRHYIDIDVYDRPPYQNIPRSWEQALAKYSNDSLQRNGILPWYLEKELALLTRAFRERDQYLILKVSAELGHYIADGHVPLHACSNHNGQFTDQHGIHGLWESRIPELLADTSFDYWAGRAVYLPNPRVYFWRVVTESGLAADTVLREEKRLSLAPGSPARYAFEPRNGKLTRSYSSAYTMAYNALLGGMVERRMKQAIHAVASCWYTAWVNAGQPSLRELSHTTLTVQELLDFTNLQRQWLHGQLQGRSEED